MNPVVMVLILIIALVVVKHWRQKILAGLEQPIDESEVQEPTNTDRDFPAGGA